ncbi:heme exporter protein CcmB [Salipaludibacillus agaradhaerens]|uniref:heme exporter protein CcmB n=1 Tax=Salipaludibacillus agaradhaerens TaxID=76935 RepID=UPI0009988849|nr:heme exporter protein CcmB [Salipaludibacillus agaradhaerens]
MLRTLLKPALVIAWKDLSMEWRTKQTLSAMLIFSGLVIVTFSFAFDPSNQAVQALVPGMIWVMTIFSGVIGLNRSFMAEQQHDNIHGLMAAPVDPASIYLGKCLANFVFVLIVQLISIPLLFILFDFHVVDYMGLGYLLIIISLGTFGFIAVGTLLAALVAHATSSEILLPVLLFPLVMPVVIAGVQATRIVLIGQEGTQDVLSWLQLIAAYDVIFFAAGFLLFDYVLEV